LQAKTEGKTALMALFDFDSDLIQRDAEKITGKNYGKTEVNG
jgi:hypothetical protein